MDDPGTSCAWYNFVTMEAQNVAILRAIRPMLGTTIGVGMFGLPYVFYQVGFGLGFVEFVLIGALNALALCLYAELVLARKKHAHFVEVIGAELGFWGRLWATVSFFATMWGAMVAYIIVSASFIGLITGADPSVVISLLFAALASLVLAGGVAMMLRIQSIVFPVFFALIAVLLLASFSHFELEHFTTVHFENAVVPLGVMLFAVSGLSAVPEVRDALGKRDRLLFKVIVAGMGIAMTVFLAFVIAILAFNGGDMSPDGISGIVRTAGRPLAIVAASVGTLVVFSAFVTIGTSILNTFMYDFSMRFSHAWLATVGVPIAIFILGARDFIDVIGSVGGVLGGVSGLLILFAYEKARRSGELPKRALRVPRAATFLCFVLYAAMIVLTLMGVGE